jgi:aminoglycoside phosphotransferase family enzyme/predicted kinase
MEVLDPELLSALARPDAYPSDASAASGVEPVQTHLSRVFLTRERVYKLRKAVKLSFVDFSTREARNADCLREVALNRRLAPDVYLGVAPLRRAGPGGFVVGEVRESLGAASPVGEVPEHCVVMRRLPGGRDALSLLERGELGPRHLDAVARALARFHGLHGLGRPAPWTGEAWLEKTVKPLRDCVELLRTLAPPVCDPVRLERVARSERGRARALEDRFEARRLAGRAVDGHGDVHLQHVWFETGAEEPLLIDCLEFDEELRRIDVASEVAFLAMDLAYRGARQLGERFLRRYAAETDDFDLYGVVDYLAAYRAFVRAKVAGIAARDAGIEAGQRAAAERSAASHLELAEGFLREPRGGALLVLCGVVGSGKSSAAEALADPGRGVVISSDRTRKRMAGLAATDRPGAALGGGIYRREVSDRVYRGLLDRAAAVVESGRLAVLDAAFAQAHRRRAALAWAADRAVPAFLVEVVCSPEVALERLARREAEGRDPSDAGPALHAQSVEDFEPPEEWPAERLARLRTDDPSWRDGIPSLLERAGPSAASALAPFVHSIGGTDGSAGGAR